MGLALLFPGQGTQHAEALPWLERQAAAEGVLGCMAAVVGTYWRARLVNPEWASTNRIAQPLVTGMSLAAWHCLATQLPAPTVMAGYSVGELAACSAAGVFDAGTALSLSVDRAQAMDRSTAGGPAGLLAVHGLDAGASASLCDRHGLSVAIRLNEQSYILGGAASSLDAAEHMLTAAGVRATRLAIQVASHTAWMAQAALEFEQRLAGVCFHAPRAPLVTNFTAQTTRASSRLKQDLARQIASPIQWDACMDVIAERGARCVLEVGPGASLSHMWNARFSDVPARSVDEFNAPEAIAAWVWKCLKT